MKRYRLSLAVLLMLLYPSMVLATEGWEWTAEPTPGAENEIVSESGEEVESYSNGDLSSDIVLSEIMPDPEGSDTETEWIELYNAGTEDIDLGNWSLDDEDGGSSPHVFAADTVIEAQDFLVVYRTESDLALNNDADTVRLFNFEGTLQEEVTYESAPEGQSYARISVEEETAEGGFLAWFRDTHSTPALAWLIPMAHAQENVFLASNWEWTKEITQGSLNPIYHLVEGTISEMLPFKNSVTLNQEDTSIELSLEKIDVEESLKSMLFQTGNWIQGYATQTSANFFELRTLEDYEMTSSNTENDRGWIKWLFLVTLSAAGGIAFYQYRRSCRGEARLLT
jgi:hypothetical protein